MLHLLIRADASTQIGSGHIMRCLALAQGWHSQCGPVTFACAQIPDALRDRLQSEQFDIRLIPTAIGSTEDAASTSALAQELNAEWVVLDGYAYTVSYQRILKQTARVLLIDDHVHLDAYAVNTILNQNSTAEAASHVYTQRAPGAELLLGSRYALLRKEFHPYRSWRRVIASAASKILVTLGGADPDNVTEQVLSALELIDPPLEVCVVIGSGNPHPERLTAAASQSRHHMTIVHNVRNMPELMTWADVALTSASSTVWEAALVGLPLLTVTLADNQTAIAADLALRGAAVNLGTGSQFNPHAASRSVAAILEDRERRASMSSLLQTLVDGYGVDRAMQHLRGDPLWLRRVQPDDARMIWEWANEPSVRAASFFSDPIPWDTHKHWFHAKMNSPTCAIFIGLDASDRPFGHVRFDDLDTDTAVISVTIDPQRRGRGLGSSLIDRATRQIFVEHRNLHAVDAWIKAENVASRRAFEKAGYAFQEHVLYRGHEAVRCTRRRPDTLI